MDISRRTILKATAFGTVAFAVGRELASAQAPTGAAMEANDRVIIANEDSNTISVIDMATRTVVKKIESKGFPYRVQFTPNGKWALIPHAQSGELVVCDVEKMEVVRGTPDSAE